MNRRDLLRLSLASAAFGPALARAAELPEPTPRHLPRWRGFNLLNKFNGQNKPFDEKDFADIAKLGFDFVRLPMDYRMWTEKGDLKKLKEPVLKEIDQAVEFGKKHGIHVQPNFHRHRGTRSPRRPSRNRSGPIRRSSTSAPFSGRPSPSGTRASRTRTSASTWSTSRPTRSSPRITAASSRRSPRRSARKIPTG